MCSIANEARDLDMSIMALDHSHLHCDLYI